MPRAFYFERPPPYSRDLPGGHGGFTAHSCAATPMWLSPDTARAARAMGQNQGGGFHGREEDGLAAPQAARRAPRRIARAPCDRASRGTRRGAASAPGELDACQRRRADDHDSGSWWGQSRRVVGSPAGRSGRLAARAGRSVATAAVGRCGAAELPHGLPAMARGSVASLRSRVGSRRAGASRGSMGVWGLSSSGRHARRAGCRI